MTRHLDAGGRRMERSCIEVMRIIAHENDLEGRAYTDGNAGR